MSRSVLGIVAAVAVAAVLLLAGVTKVARPAAWRAEAAGMGVRGPLAAVVPWMELGLGALLVAQVQRHVVAWVAVGLFRVHRAHRSAAVPAAPAAGRR